MRGKYFFHISFIVCVAGIAVADNAIQARQYMAIALVDILFLYAIKFK